MALISLVTGSANSGSAVTTTTSATPMGSIILSVWAKNNTTDFTNGTTVSGNSMTWVKVGEVIEVGGSHTLLTVWVGYAATPTTGSITITFSQTPNSGLYHVLDTGDARASNPTSGAVTNSGSATSGSNTLAAATAGKFQVAVFGHNANEGTTPSTQTTWIEVQDTTNISGIGLEDQLGGGSVNCAASWTTSSRWAGVAFEVTSNDFTSPELFDDALAVGDAKAMNAVLVDEGDEEGPTIAGRPSGTWAIIGS